MLCGEEEDGERKAFALSPAEHKSTKREQAELRIHTIFRLSLVVYRSRRKQESAVYFRQVILVVCV